MKKNLIIAAAVIVVLLGGYLLLRKNTPKQGPWLEPVAVSAIKKTVNHYSASSTKTEVIEPLKAFEGDEVETLFSGRALLQMQNGTLTTLDYSTKITIQSHTDDEHSNILLQSGKVWSTVEKIFGKGEYYEIETQNAVAVVRGTSFGVSFDGANTILEVSEGAVLFVPIDPETGERLYDEAILVPAGKKAILGSSSVIEVSDLTVNDTDREWYIYNNGAKDISDQAGDTNQNLDVRISNVEIKADQR